jgi:hypothetical protein
MARITERQLILPALFLMSLSPARKITADNLIPRLREILKPTGTDIKIIKGRRDDYFSQIAIQYRCFRVLRVHRKRMEPVSAGDMTMKKFHEIDNVIVTADSLSLRIDGQSYRFALAEISPRLLAAPPGFWFWTSKGSGGVRGCSPHGTSSNSCRK